MAAHQPRTRSAVTYSAPVMGGRFSSRRPAVPSSSAGSPAASACSGSASWHTRPSNDRDSSRKNARAGGSGVSSSAAPRCSSPAPSPSEKATVRRTAASSDSGAGRGGVGSGRRWPVGETSSDSDTNEEEDGAATA